MLLARLHMLGRILWQAWLSSGPDGASESIASPGQLQHVQPVPGLTEHRKSCSRQSRVYVRRTPPVSHADGALAQG